MTATIPPGTVRPSDRRPASRHNRLAMFIVALCAALAYSHSTAWTVADACHFSNGRRALDRPWDALGWFPTIALAIDFPMSRLRPSEPASYRLRWRAGRPLWIIRSDNMLNGEYQYYDLAGFMIARASWGCTFRCGPDDYLVWTGPALDADPDGAFYEDDRADRW